MPHQWVSSSTGADPAGTTVVQVDSSLSDTDRRSGARDGDAFVYTPTGESLALVAWMRVLLEQAFAPQAPADARTSLDAARFGAGVGLAAQEMVHHPRTTRMVRSLLIRLQFDMHLTYVDVPALHAVHAFSSTPTGGVARPLRPAGYAPAGAVDWLLPIYPLEYPAGADDRTVALPPGAVLGFDPTAGHPAVRDVRRRTSFALRLRTVHLDDTAQPTATAQPIDTVRSDARPAPVRTLRDLRRASDGAPLPGIVPSRTGGFVPGAGYPPVL